MKKYNSQIAYATTGGKPLVSKALAVKYWADTEYQAHTYYL